MPQLVPMRGTEQPSNGQRHGTLFTNNCSQDDGLDSTAYRLGWRTKMMKE